MIKFIQIIFQTLIWLLFILTTLKILGICLIILFQNKRRGREYVDNNIKSKIDIIIAAYNEESVIAQTINNLLEIDYDNFKIIVVNDGSTDRTLEILKIHYGSHPKVKIVSQNNKGKSQAINYGLTFSTAEIITFIDADTQVLPNVLQIISKCFANNEICAVSGYLKVQNLENMLTIGQNIEYATTQNLEREIFSKIDTLTTIPGAICAFRRINLLKLGSFRDETIAEDCDITFKFLKANYLIINEKKAIAYTLAPNSLRMFIRQRIRWDYGLIQNLLKHIDIKKETRIKSWLVIFYNWIYRIGYTLIFPIADYLFLLLLIIGEVNYYYLYFLVIETLIFLITLIKKIDNINLKTFFFLFYRVLFRHFKFFALLLCIQKYIKKEKLQWKKIKRPI